MQRLLSSQSVEEIGRGLFTYVALLWEIVHCKIEFVPSDFPRLPVAIVEQHLFQKEQALWAPAAWAWGLIHELLQSPLPQQPSPAVLDRLLTLWQGDAHQSAGASAALALSAQFGLPRRVWRPVLTDAQVQRIRKVKEIEETDYKIFDSAASLMVAFHARNVWSEDELASLLVGLLAALEEEPFWLERSTQTRRVKSIKFMLEQIGETGGRAYLNLEKQQPKSRSDKLIERRDYLSPCYQIACFTQGNGLPFSPTAILANPNTIGSFLTNSEPNENPNRCKGPRRPA